MHHEARLSDALFIETGLKHLTKPRSGKHFCRYAYRWASRLRRRPCWKFFFALPILRSCAILAAGVFRVWHRSGLCVAAAVVAEGETVVSSG